MSISQSAVAVAVVALGACGGGQGRPSGTEWATVWRGERESVPAAEVFVERGEELCGELVGQLRSSRVQLLPTPTDVLDDAVHAWLGTAESIAFDCPTDDPDELRDRLHDLDVLAAEVDAGLIAEQTP